MVTPTTDDAPIDAFFKFFPQMRPLPQPEGTKSKCYKKRANLISRPAGSHSSRGTLFLVLSASYT